MTQGPKSRDLPAWLLLAAALPLLWRTSQAGGQLTFSARPFLFFHGAVELVVVLIALLIFVTGYRAVLSARKDAVVLLGVAFLGVALLDYAHILSYVGMSDAVTTNTPHKSMFFWLAARLLAAIALLAYAAWPASARVGTVQKRLALACVLILVAVTVCVGLIWPHRIPRLFIAGHGLTWLKIGLEWLAGSINAATVVVLVMRRRSLAFEHLRALIYTAALLAVSSVFFTQLGAIDTDAANALGHVYKLAAYFYLFDATCNEALRRPIERLEVQCQRETTILDAAPDGVLWVDDMGTILTANAAIESLTGYSPGEVIGNNVDLFLPPHLRAGHGDAIRRHFRAPRARAMGRIDLKLRRRDGQLTPVDISLGNFRDGGRDYAIAYIRDLTERKKYEESLRHQATHDELTGLPNRWLFRYQLEQDIARASRSGLSLAVLFLDLDYFKNINDSYGHPAGDALLAQVSSRIQESLRENDMLARLGGDEFGISLCDLANPGDALNVASSVLVRLQTAFRIAGHDVYSGASLGLAFYPADARDSDTLLRYADMAMYQAKQGGRGAYVCYSQEMDIRAHADMLLHTQLKAALSLGLLEMHYQPQVDVRTGQVVGAEALLRSRDPVMGGVAPSRLIAIAEATGLMLELSEYVLAMACRDIATWHNCGTPLRISVNFSAQQFRQGSVEETVRGALALAGAPAHLLCVEITESVAMAHPEEARRQMCRLREMGCAISLDDFGTGYSSLAYLKSLPITEVKIDRSFIHGVPADHYDMAIAQTIITLAHSLGLSLVAEGVENEDQLAFLRAHACEHYQGWLFAPALSPAELQALLTHGAVDVPMRALI